MSLPDTARMDRTTRTARMTTLPCLLLLAAQKVRMDTADITRKVHRRTIRLITRGTAVTVVSAILPDHPPLMAILAVRHPTVTPRALHRLTDCRGLGHTVHHPTVTLLALLPITHPGSCLTFPLHLATRLTHPASNLTHLVALALLLPDRRLVCLAIITLAKTNVTLHHLLVSHLTILRLLRRTMDLTNLMIIRAIEVARMEARPRLPVTMGQASSASDGRSEACAVRADMRVDMGMVREAAMGVVEVWVGLQAEAGPGSMATSTSTTTRSLTSTHAALCIALIALTNSTGVTGIATMLMGSTASRLSPLARSGTSASVNPMNTTVLMVSTWERVTNMM